MKNFIYYLFFRIKYYTKKIINFSKYFTENDLLLLKHLGCNIKKRLYSEYEYDLLNLKLIEYYENSKDVNGKKIPPIKIIDESCISKKDYSRLLKIFTKIGQDYNF